MHFTLSALSALALAGASAAQYTSSFYLIAISHDDVSKYDGVGLSACHAGAGIEVLCYLPNASSSSSTFNLETTRNQTGGNVPGILTWILDTGSANYTQSMSLANRPSSNMAQMMFAMDTEDGGVPQVFFDEYGVMAVDDSFSTYICESEVNGYNYNTLNVVYDNGTTVDPSCNRVQVGQILLSQSESS